MSTSVLSFPAVETEVRCGECGKGIDPEMQFAFECAECGAWICKSCEHCDCDRLALLVQRSLNRLQPSLWMRVRRWFEHGF
jgi:hypothetical protein